MEKEIFRNALAKSFQDAMAQVTSGEVNKLAMLKFCGEYDKKAPWRVGPFAKDEGMTFKLQKQWNDPWNIGWQAGFLFNPSLIVKGDALYMFYRAAPKKETLCSRIGLAIWREETGWQDYAENPVIYPTEEDELLSVEDPKVYAAEGRYYMFYNGIYNPTEKEMRDVGLESFSGVAVDMKCAVSDDLMHWTKIGRVVPRAITKLWVKGAVIPRDPEGNAVKLGGKYIMYISEGCGGQHIGLSEDMLHWTFERKDYLDASSIGMLHEVANVACAPERDDMCMDFFCSKDGIFKAGQARFKKDAPYTQLETEQGGSLSWGGALKWQGRWIVAQGWDAQNGDNEMYIYRAAEDNA